MARDLRDPKALGDLLLSGRPAPGVLPYALRTHPSIKMSRRYDSSRLIWDQVENYSANPGPLEKYGDPTKLPSTLPN